MIFQHWLYFLSAFLIVVAVLVVSHFVQEAWGWLALIGGGIVLLVIALAMAMGVL